MISGVSHNIATVIGVLAASGALCHLLLRLLRPLLQRYALALPNARSSHKIPTPQGAGIGVVVATVIVVAAIAAATNSLSDPQLWVILAATVGIAIVGAVDDIAPIAVLPRLTLQAAAVTAIVLTMPEDMRIISFISQTVERGLLVIGALWFVNLYNFMDGLDWITAAETIPITAFLVVISHLDAAPELQIVAALALCGAMIGFAPLNRPVAKMFLGDVGSLAIGLLLAWMLIGLAGRGHLAAAILLPLYYIADATITLLRRLMRREKIWIAHRTHFYQRATQNGFAVMSVVTRIFAVNIALGLLALASTVWPHLAVQIGALVCGAAMVALVLYNFTKERASPP